MEEELKIDYEFVRNIRRKIHWNEARMLIAYKMWVDAIYFSKPQVTYVLSPVDFDTGFEYYVDNAKVTKQQRREWRRNNKFLKK